jgi:hypothetical protein
MAQPNEAAGPLVIYQGTGKADGLTVTSLELDAIRLWCGLQAQAEQEPVVIEYLQRAAAETDEALLRVLFMAKVRASAEGRTVLSIELSRPPQPKNRGLLS